MKATVGRGGFAFVRLARNKHTNTMVTDTTHIERTIEYTSIAGGAGKVMIH